MRYAIVIRQISAEDGGGYIGLVPDLPGCMSDGETPAQALANTMDAMSEWLDLCHRRGQPEPVPGWRAERMHKERQELVEQLAKLKMLDRNLETLQDRMAEVGRSIRDLQDALEQEDRWINALSITVDPRLPFPGPGIASQHH